MTRRGHGKNFVRYSSGPYTIGFVIYSTEDEWVAYSFKAPAEGFKTKQEACDFLEAILFPDKEDD